MSEIQRYNYDKAWGMEKHELGDSVDYDDHAVIVAQLESDLAEARKEGLEAKQDQARYQYLMFGLGAVEMLNEPPKWTFRTLPKCTRAVFKGSVSGHFSDAIDAAIKESSK